jgi:hypothetical protein
MAKLYSCAETHEVTRRATSTLRSSMYCAFAQGPPASAPMAYTASSKRLLLGRLARGAPQTSSPWSTAVALEAASAPPAARFLPLPFSSLVQLIQSLKKECIRNFMAVASSKSALDLEGSAIRPMAQRTPPGRVKGFATRAARAAHAGPRAAAHAMASPVALTCPLPKKAALRSEAAMGAMMTAHVF